MSTIIDPVGDREAWLAERRNGIGASEAAAVCGVSDHDTPLDVYLRKVGLAPEKPESPAMRWGSLHEPTIARAYSEDTGADLVDEQRFVRSPVHPWMFATLDRVRADGRPVELKTIGVRAAYALGDQLGESGSDVVPFTWRCQALHQMVVTGTEAVDVAALVGGNDFRIYTIPFDARVADRLVAMEAEFWDRVQRREPPEIDPNKDGVNLARLYPEPEGALPLPIETEVEIEEWLHLKNQIQQLQRSAERLKTSIVASLGPFAEGQMSDGRVIVRKSVRRDGYTVEPCTYIDLRVKKGVK